MKKQEKVQAACGELFRGRVRLHTSVPCLDDVAAHPDSAYNRLGSNLDCVHVEEDVTYVICFASCEACITSFLPLTELDGQHTPKGS